MIWQAFDYISLFDIPECENVCPYFAQNSGGALIFKGAKLGKKQV